MMEVNIIFGKATSSLNKLCFAVFMTQRIRVRYTSVFLRVAAGQPPMKLESQEWNVNV